MVHPFEFTVQDLIKKNIADRSKTEDFKKRIRLITAGWPADEIHDFVQNNQLLESPEFLIGLLDGVKASEKTLIVEQLEEVTGQELKVILDKWKATQSFDQQDD